MSNGLSIIFTCLYDLFDIVFMKHNVVYVFVILVDDVYCVAIHDLSPVLTALFSIELGGFNSQHKAEDVQSTFRLRVLITMVFSAVFCVFEALVLPCSLGN